MGSSPPAKIFPPDSGKGDGGRATRPHKAVSATQPHAEHANAGQTRTDLLPNHGQKTAFCCNWTVPQRAVYSLCGCTFLFIPQGAEFANAH